MYPEAALTFFPYLDGGLLDLSHNQQFDFLHGIREDELQISTFELQQFQSSDLPLSLLNQSNVVKSTTITDYDLGGEGDLFKAPEPIVEIPEYDAVAAVMSSMISSEDGDLAAAIEVPISDTKKNLPEKSELSLAGCDREMQRSESSGNLRRTRPNFLDFQGLNIESVFGMRRAYSEGDIQVLS